MNKTELQSVLEYIRDNCNYALADLEKGQELGAYEPDAILAGAERLMLRLGKRKPVVHLVDEHSLMDDE